MLPTTLSLVGAVILGLDIFAMVSVLIGSSGIMRKLMWIAVIFLLPFVHAWGCTFSLAEAQRTERVTPGQPVRDVIKQPLGKGVTIMGGKVGVVKGRIKEAAGALTGNDKLARKRSFIGSRESRAGRPEGRRHGQESREKGDWVSPHDFESLGCVVRREGGPGISRARAAQEPRVF